MNNEETFRQGWNVTLTSSLLKAREYLPSPSESRKVSTVRGSSTCYTTKKIYMTHVISHMYKMSKAYKFWLSEHKLSEKKKKDLTGKGLFCIILPNGGSWLKGGNRWGFGTGGGNIGLAKVGPLVGAWLFRTPLNPYGEALTSSSILLRPLKSSTFLDGGEPIEEPM